MKKILLIIFASVLLGQYANAQCTCNPNGWQPVAVILNNVNSTVNCGHQFSLKCTDNITLRSSYKCIGNCVTKYSAVLKNAVTGVVVMNYPSFTFPWSYHFPAAGNYSLEITPICGTTKCTPCRFFFTVTCTTPVVCDCDPNGWQPFTGYIGTVKQAATCGYQFGLKKGQQFRLAGLYKCKGTCVAKYTAVLKNNVTGAIIMNYPTFTFTWSYIFATAGNYKLEIIPWCGDKRCNPCVFYFTVI